jgi:hypothetical protein
MVLAWGVSGFERWPAPSPWPLTLEIVTSVLAGSVVSGAPTDAGYTAAFLVSAVVSRRLRARPSGDS